MEYKFNIGDKVELVKDGSGHGTAEVRKFKGTWLTITERGVYTGNISGTKPGYKTFPATGNTLTGRYNGFNGEASYELMIAAAPELLVIPRVAFKEIADEVCLEWRNRIHEYLMEQKYDAIISVPKVVIENAYKAANNSIQLIWLRKYCPIETTEEIEVVRFAIITSEGVFKTTYPTIIEANIYTREGEHIVEFKGKYTKTTKL